MNKTAQSTLSSTTLIQDQNLATYQFTGYRPGQATVNNKIITSSSFIIAPEKGIFSWDPLNLETLNTAHWLPILTLKPHIIIVGVGEELIFPTTEIIAPLLEKGIGVEFMTNAVACGTYNLLASDDRNVVGAFLLSS